MCTCVSVLHESTRWRVHDDVLSNARAQCARDERAEHAHANTPVPHAPVCFVCLSVTLRVGAHSCSFCSFLFLCFALARSSRSEKRQSRAPPLPPRVRGNGSVVRLFLRHLNQRKASCLLSSSAHKFSDFFFSNLWARSRAHTTLSRTRILQNIKSCGLSVPRVHESPSSTAAGRRRHAKKT
jgi:hypothetical protein